MKTEITTNSKYPVFIDWQEDMLVTTSDKGQEVIYDKSEAIQLRNFLNQLNLGEEK